MTVGDRQRIVERCLDDAGRQVDTANQFGAFADQRAVTLAGFYFGAAVAIIAGLAAWASQGSLPASVLWGGSVAVVGLYVGAGMCIWVSRPKLAMASGNPPDFWKWHLDRSGAYGDALEAQIGHYEGKISDHKTQLAKSSRQYLASAAIGGLAPIAGAALYLILSLCD